MGRNTKLITAKQLIDEKNYEAARAVLNTIGDDPTAQRWLRKLDEIAPRKSSVIRPIDASQPPIPLPPIPPLVQSSGIAYQVVCPKCENQSPQPINPESVVHNFRCPHCGTNFAMLLYQIRASSSRGYDTYRRNYSIRVFGTVGGENQLTFSTQKNLRMELRSKDIAGFTSLDSKIRVVQNFTIRKYWMVTQESILAWIVVGVFAVIVFIFWAGNNFK